MTFEPQIQYDVGDKIGMEVWRGPLAIWWDRLRLRCWDVQQTKMLWFECVSKSPGSIWPQVSE